MLNLNDKKTKNYRILVALATCVLNREYVITNYTHIIENSPMIPHFFERFAISMHLVLNLHISSVFSINYLFVATTVN